MNNVFVYIELENGVPADVSLELLTKGRELATTLGVKLEAVVLGHNPVSYTHLDVYKRQVHRLAADKVDDAAQYLRPAVALIGTVVRCV